MKPPLSWLLRLYPKAWRDRYGLEFEALVDDKGKPWQHAADIFIEALKMRIVSTNWKLITSFGLAGLIVAAAVSWQIPNRYVSMAVLQVIAPPGTAPDASTERITQIQNRILSRTSLSNVIQKPDLNLYKDERAHKPLEDIIEEMKLRDLKIAIDSKVRSNGRPFVISFAATDRVIAQATVQQLVARTMDENFKVAASQTPMQLEVLDPASLPVYPVSPNRPAIALAGVFLGIIVGGIIAWRHSKGRPPGGTGTLAQTTGAGFLLSALLIVAGADLTAGIVSWPCASRAALEFGTPETRTQLIAQTPSLTKALSQTVSEYGAWLDLDLKPTSGSSASVAIRYSNCFKARLMLQTSTSRIRDTRGIDWPSLQTE